MGYRPFGPARIVPQFELFAKFQSACLCWSRRKGVGGRQQAVCGTAHECAQGSGEGAASEAPSCPLVRPRAGSRQEGLGCCVPCAGPAAELGFSGGGVARGRWWRGWCPGGEARGEAETGGRKQFSGRDTFTLQLEFMEVSVYDKCFWEMWKQGSIPVAVKGRRSGDGGRGRCGRGRRRPTCRPLCLPALRHESLQQQLQRVGAAAPHRHAGPAEQLLLAGEDGASGDRGRDRLQVSESGSLGWWTTAAPKPEQALEGPVPWCQ